MTFIADKSLESIFQQINDQPVVICDDRWMLRDYL